MPQYFVKPLYSFGSIWYNGGRMIYAKRDGI